MFYRDGVNGGTRVGAACAAQLEGYLVLVPPEHNVQPTYMWNVYFAFCMCRIHPDNDNSSCGWA